jgi:hypothetical protein
VSERARRAPREAGRDEDVVGRHVVPNTQVNLLRAVAVKTATPGRTATCEAFEKLTVVTSG